MHAAVSLGKLLNTMLPVKAMPAVYEWCLREKAPEDRCMTECVNVTCSVKCF